MASAEGDGQGPAKRQHVEAPLAMLRVGFCGVDDSVTVAKLAALSKDAPWIEWGVLFRPEKEGEPRFPTAGWVDELSAAAKETPAVRLAAHLCSTRCEEVLHGDAAFVQTLFDKGFRRTQVNATAANGVDTSKLAEQAEQVMACIKAVPGMEWILQRNEETRPIWEPILARRTEFPNVSVLFDESVGTGVQVKTFACPSTLEGTPCGYAGGIGPANIRAILEAMRDTVGEAFKSAAYRAPWVDMESSLRQEVEGKDIFSLEQVEACVKTVRQAEADAVVSLGSGDATVPSEGEEEKKEKEKEKEKEVEAAAAADADADKGVVQKN